MYLHINCLPHVAAGSQRTSSKADVWALGCVALQLFAAEPVRAHLCSCIGQSADSTMLQDGKPWSEEGDKGAIYHKVVIQQMSPLDVTKYQPPDGFLRTLLLGCFQYDPESRPVCTQVFSLRICIRSSRVVSCTGLRRYH